MQRAHVLGDGGAGIEGRGNCIHKALGKQENTSLLGKQQQASPLGPIEQGCGSPSFHHQGPFHSLMPCVEVIIHDLPPLTPTKEENNYLPVFAHHIFTNQCYHIEYVHICSLSISSLWLWSTTPSPLTGLLQQPSKQSSYLQSFSTVIILQMMNSFISE